MWELPLLLLLMQILFKLRAGQRGRTSQGRQEDSANSQARQAHFLSPWTCGEQSQLSLVCPVTSDKHPGSGPQDPPPLGAAWGGGGGCPPASALPSFS